MLPVQTTRGASTNDRIVSFPRRICSGAASRSFPSGPSRFAKIDVPSAVPRPSVHAARKFVPSEAIAGESWLNAARFGMEGESGTSSRAKTSGAHSSTSEARRGSFI